VNDEIVGHISRCAFSPRLERNIGISNVPAELTEIGSRLVVKTPDGPANAEVVKTPWFPAQKILPDIRGDH
jgi:aminomethyltransferase